MREIGTINRRIFIGSEDEIPTGADAAALPDGSKFIDEVNGQEYTCVDGRFLNENKKEMEKISTTPITKSEYEALPPEEKNDGKIRFLKEG